MTLESMALEQRRRAFTLIELLVVLGIIAILAGILTPVFVAARHSARQTTCISNMRQVNLASTLYVTDYDERTVPASYKVQETGTSTTDRTWVQLLLPYVRAFGTFRCPGDYSERPNEQAHFDADLVQGDTYSRYYRASQRSNLGYNYLYHSPLVRIGSADWQPLPRSTSAVGEPSRAFVYVDSVWSMEPDGRPKGGGSYLVLPPCRYSSQDTGRYDTFLIPALSDTQIYKVNTGWIPGSGGRMRQYGGAFPWHRGRFNVGMADGSAKALALGNLIRGCDVRVNWGGEIYDLANYGWDIN